MKRYIKTVEELQAWLIELGVSWAEDMRRVPDLEKASLLCRLGGVDVNDPVALGRTLCVTCSDLCALAMGRPCKGMAEVQWSNVENLDRDMGERLGRIPVSG